MKNSEYWKNRFKQLEEAQNCYSQKAYTEIEQLYQTAQRQIEKDIRAWYQRFADNNQISLSEARQWISGNALKEFKWDVQEYIKYGKDNAVSGQWMKQLENVSAKFHISKLEMLKIQTQQSMEELFMKQHGIVNSTMSDVFKSGYYHTAYELQKGFNVGWDISGLNQSYVEKLLSKPWAADKYNFSDRIWSSKDKLINNIHTELTQNIMLGEDPQKAIDALSKQMGTSKYNAGRLVQTEQAYFSQLAQGECFNALGVEKYEIVEALDSHTCDICGAYDGQVFDMTDYNPGVTAPPWHPNCRGTTCPYFDDKFDIGKRAARDENGNTYYVPDNMAYKEWKSVFVDGGDKSELTEIGENGAKAYTRKDKEVIAGVKRGEPMTFDKANSGNVNPKYGIKYGYSINCQSCVPTFEARIRGYDVQVKPLTKGSMLDKLSSQTNLIWIDPATGTQPKYVYDDEATTPKKCLAFIDSVIKAGQRWSIQFSWKGRKRTGHIVNIDRIGDDLRIKDNQRSHAEKSTWIGEKEVLSYLKQMKYTTSIYGHKVPCVPKLLRIDNMDFDLDVANQIMERME